MAGTRDRRAGHSLPPERGLARPRLRTDGAVVVTSAGYRNVAQATIPAEELVGAHVRLIVDSAPGAFGDGNLQAL